MAGYPGIAAYTSDFNQTRDSALESGYRAKQRYREDAMADYDMPNRFAESRANYLGNAIKADTRARGYADYVHAGVADASRGARESQVNLDKVVADQTLARLRGEASAKGAQSPEEISHYVQTQIDPAELAANPYLSEAVLGQRRQAGQQMLNMGSALGGGLGDDMMNRGLAGLGYRGVRAQRNGAGNVYFEDAGGQRSDAYGRAGQLPAAAAMGGDVSALDKYYTAQGAQQQAMAAKRQEMMMKAPAVQNFYSGDGEVQKIWNPGAGRYEDVGGYMSGAASGPYGPLVRAVMAQESGGDPGAVSPAGARGLMQLMPGTQRDPGFGVAPARDDSPEENMRVGAQYLGAMVNRYGGDQALGLAAYNAGPGRVDGALQASGGDAADAIRMLTNETQQYVRQVPQRMAAAGSPYVAQATAERLGVRTKPRDASDAKFEKLTALGYTRDEAAAAAYRVKPSESAPDVTFDPNAPNGDAYLATLPADRRNIVKAVVEGRYPLPQGRAATNPFWMSVLKDAGQVDPEFDGGNYPARVAARKAWTSGKDAALTSSLNMTAGHLADFADVLRKLDNSNFSPWNKAKTDGAYYYGSERAKALGEYRMMAKALGDEVAKLFAGGQSGVGDREEMAALFDPNATSAAQRASLIAAVKLIQSRIDSQQEKVDQALGYGAGSIQVVSPKAKKLFDTFSDMSVESPWWREKPSHGKEKAERAGAVAPASKQGPAAGAVVDGYRFKGGSPADQANWEKL